ncbi:unnamed protein product [Leptidea sinapis]|uniref:Amine oxidase domain-containing protein n=1 Tax=Leptidea sinapis TaxID=189913 RepID=A0A5E4PZ90_9NEOP|nr:unnamed protein product [Leptidea sinapis]
MKRQMTGMMLAHRAVTQIKWPRDTTGNVEVVCKDGSTYTASNVIVTLSLGVLKERHTSLFSPELPRQKLEPIEKLVMGLLDKIILRFPERWWTADKSPVFWWDSDDLEKLDDRWLHVISGASAPKGSGDTLTLWTSGDSAKLNKNV